MVSSDRWPHIISHFAEGQSPHFDMMVPVGSFCGAIITAHLCQDLGALFVARRRSSWSTEGEIGTSD